MRAVAAIAYNGFREARRNRVTVVVALFAVTLLLSSTLVTEVTVATMDRVLTDFGLGTMSMVLVLLAIFLSSGLLSREIERRTIFLLVTKPVSRATFLVGRLAGNMLTLTALLAAMTGLFLLHLFLHGRQPTPVQFIAICGLWFELLLLSAFAFVMSSFSSQIVSAVVTTGIYFAGHLSKDIYAVAMKSKSAFLQLVGKAVYYLLPNLDRLNFRPHAAYATTPALREVLESFAYGLTYALVLVGLAAFIFDRRDFR